MDHRIASAGPRGRALTATLAAFGLLAAAWIAAPPAHAAQKKAAEKSVSKKAPTAKPAAEQNASGPQLKPSPWLKLCGKEKQQNDAKVCIITKVGILENGAPEVVVRLILPEGQPKLLQVILPLGIELLQNGTRVIIDQDTPIQAPYFICNPQGCMSNYALTDDMIKKMKKGKTITVQWINVHKTPISFPLPLKDFAKAYDGPPTDPKVLAAQQRKLEKQQQQLQSELQKKAEEARKKLEAQQPAAKKK
jgi:invasion protein IalB